MKSAVTFLNIPLKKLSINRVNMKQTRIDSDVCDGQDGVIPEEKQTKKRIKVSLKDSSNHQIQVVLT